MKAKVTVEFILKNVCSKEDLEGTKLSFEQMVRWLIKEEGGVIGLTSGRGKIIKVKEIK